MEEQTEREQAKMEARNHVIEERLKRVREQSALQGVDCLLVQSTSNIAWLTDVFSVFDDEQAHALFITEDRAVLHTDSRYSLALAQALKAAPIEVTVVPPSLSEFVVEQVNELASTTKKRALKMGIEDTITIAELRLLETAAAKANVALALVETSGVVAGLREVKAPEEIEAIKAAQAITDAAFAYIQTWMQPGMTERQVQQELDRQMFELGADGLAFETIVASGPQGASPHARPGSRKLTQGDAVVMDFGAKKNGYCSDMTRTVFIGAPSSKQMQAWQTLRRANEKVEEQLKPDMTGAQAHAIAEDELASGGFAGKMGHGLGHSVGRDIHESPNLSPRNKKPLQAGNVVTVEPGIYLANEFGMRLEDLCVVTDEGIEVLTQTPHELIVIAAKDE